MLKLERSDIQKHKTLTEYPDNIGDVRQLYISHNYIGDVWNETKLFTVIGKPNWFESADMNHNTEKKNYTNLLRLNKALKVHSPIQ
jgi:hypothetical protein